MQYRILIASLFAGLFLVAGSAFAGGTKVKVSHGSFEPAEVTISAGEKVVFKNVVDMPGGHTIAIEEIDAASESLDNGEKWSHTFDEPGTYHFYVKEHSDNKGTVVVE
jgi:plastocyanin